MIKLHIENLQVTIDASGEDFSVEVKPQLEKKIGMRRWTIKVISPDGWTNGGKDFPQGYIGTFDVDKESLGYMQSYIDDGIIEKVSV